MSSATTKQSDTRTNTDPQGPSDAAKEAVGKVIGTIEGLNPQDRGYLLNRLAQVYYGGRSAKDVRSALSAKKTQARKGPTKSSWKETWEATTEYQAWQNHIAAGKQQTETERAASAPEYLRLRAEAFRVRDELKARNEDATAPEAGAKAPTAQGSDTAQGGPPTPQGQGGYGSAGRGYGNGQPKADRGRGRGRG